MPLIAFDLELPRGLELLTTCLQAFDGRDREKPDDLRKRRTESPAMSAACDPCAISHGPSSPPLSPISFAEPS